MVIEQARILSNEKLAGKLYSLRLLAPRIASHYQGPGQFVSLTIDDRWEHPLRRPMSIASVAGEILTLLYKPVGVVTNLLTQQTVSRTLNLLGPRGNTFTHASEDYYPVLVGGGTGLAPIINLHTLLEEQGRKHTVILGARTAEEHFLPHKPQSNFYITTDDGSLGNPGTVIPTLEVQLQHHIMSFVYACGPQSMLAAIQELVKTHDIPAQLSVESYLACSMGFCQGCVIKRKVMNPQEHSYHQCYSLVCEEGPVYQSEEIVFD